MDMTDGLLHQLGLDHTLACCTEYYTIKGSDIETSWSVSDHTVDAPMFKQVY